MITGDYIGVIDSIYNGMYYATIKKESSTGERTGNIECDGQVKRLSKEQQKIIDKGVRIRINMDSDKIYLLDPKTNKYI